jgi:hypothetical protein
LKIAAAGHRHHEIFPFFFLLRCRFILLLLLKSSVVRLQQEVDRLPVLRVGPGKDRVRFLKKEFVERKLSL